MMQARWAMPGQGSRSSRTPCSHLLYHLQSLAGQWLAEGKPVSCATQQGEHQVGCENSSYYHHLSRGLHLPPYHRALLHVMPAGGMLQWRRGHWWCLRWRCRWCFLKNNWRSAVRWITNDVSFEPTNTSSWPGATPETIGMGEFAEGAGRRQRVDIFVYWPRVDFVGQEEE